MAIDWEGLEKAREQHKVAVRRAQRAKDMREALARGWVDTYHTLFNLERLDNELEALDNG